MLNFIVPKFIKTFDRYLLLNRPFWYICKLHYILYFTVLMWALSFLIGNLLPIDIRKYDPLSSQNTWIFIFSILGVILFCVWLYHLTIYNNEDRYGRYSKFDDVKFLGVFVLGINLLMSFSYPMQYSMKTRLANSITDKELAEQYNNLNLGNKYITEDITDFQFCGYGVHENLNYDDIKNDSNAYHNDREIRDLSKYKNFLAYSPDMDYYTRFNFSNLLFGKSSVKENQSFQALLLNSQQIENHLQKHTSETEVLKDIQNYISVCDFYNLNHIISAKNYYSDYKERPDTCMDYMPDSQFIDESADFESSINTGSAVSFMNNIYKAKFDRIYLLSNSYLLFAFYFSFAFSILIITFRNNRWQHYLVTAVSFILIGIVLSILTLLLFNGSFDSVYPTLLFLTWLSCAILTVIYYFNNTKYKVVYVIASNLVYVTLPFVPFLFAMYLHDVFGLYKCPYYSSTPTAQEIYECNLNEIMFDKMFIWTQILGIAFFVIVAMPLFKLLYIKQKALPRDK